MVCGSCRFPLNVRSTKRRELRGGASLVFDPDIKTKLLHFISSISTQYSLFF